VRGWGYRCFAVWLPASFSSFRLAPKACVQLGLEACEAGALGAGTGLGSHGVDRPAGLAARSVATCGGLEARETVRQPRRGWWFVGHRGFSNFVAVRR
jgi:hypothetical protein